MGQPSVDPSSCHSRCVPGVSSGLRAALNDRHRPRFAAPLFHALIALLLCLHSASVAEAQLQLERVFPPVVACGTQTTLKAEGKFETWPVQAVVDRDSITVTFGETKGELQLQVPAEEPPGVVWLRLWDEASASGWTPVLVSPQPVVAESEPNETAGTASPVALPAAVAGRLEKSGDVDCFQIVPTADAPLVASLTANQILQSPMDAVLQVVDADGNVLAQNDDVRGRDPQIVFHPSSAEPLFVRVFAFPDTPNSTIGFAGGAAYAYVLNVTTGPFMDHALPLRGEPPSAEGTAAAFGWNLSDPPKLRFAPATRVSPPVAFVEQATGWQWQDGNGQLSQPPAVNENEALTEPAVVNIPVHYAGHLRDRDEIDRIRFAVQAQQRYRVSLASQQYGFPLDAAIEVVNAEDGVPIADNDDASRTEFDPALEFVAKQDSTVEVRIRDMANQGGPYNAYALSVEPVTAAVELSVDADRYQVTAERTLEIPVSIRRQHDYATALQVSIEGLPAGVECPPLTSTAGDDTAKSVTLKLTAGPEAAFHGEVRVIARPLDDQGQPLDQPSLAAVHALRPKIDIEHVWLTIPAKP